MSKLGFVGLGIMGTPMAGHLIAAGHQVFAYDQKDLPTDLVDKGLVRCASSKDVATACEILFVMVPDTPHVGAVLLGRTGQPKGCPKARSSST